MKNSKGQTLLQPYLDLAMMRREQQGGVGDEIDYKKCFFWRATPEGEYWWSNVYRGNTPEIPASSLAELEEWRKATISKKETVEPDYKELYEELKNTHDELCNDYENLSMDFQKLSAIKSTDRNYMIECAMAAMNGFIAKNGSISLGSIDAVAKLSFDYAEAMLAEGKKRGHL